jgi:membrane-associated protein
MPGTLLLLLFGLLAAKGAGMLIFMIIFSIIGAMVGDTIGYLLGRYGSRFFKEHNKLLKLSHIETGRAFFNKHGGKSIIFGRFIGPIRPIISLVAGAVSFLFERFLYLNFLGACVWASSYVTIGFLFGHYIKLIDRIISQIASGVLISGIIVAIFYWYFKERKVILKD